MVLIMYTAVFATRFEFFFSIFLWSALKLGNVRKEFRENAATSITTFEISSTMPSLSTWGRVSLWLRRCFHVLKGKKLLLLHWFGVPQSLPEGSLEDVLLFTGVQQIKFRTEGFFFFPPKMSALADIHYNSPFYKAIL